MDGVSIRFEGDKRLFKILDRITDPAERKELMENIGAYGVSSTQQRFLDEESPEGVEWKRSRRALKIGGATMRKSARLFQSLSFEATPTSVAWGTNVIYARIHQFGGEIRPKNAKYLAFMGVEGGMVYAKKVTMPSRPFLGINALDMQRIEKTAGQWVGGLSK